MSLQSPTALLASTAIVLVVGSGLMLASGGTVGSSAFAVQQAQVATKARAAGWRHIEFLNDDKFAHNIYSETAGFEFNFRQQMPGEKDILVLEKAIVFDVICAIHPRMKVTISVN